ncbi:tyrosine-type recombinase/integrase [Sphingomonas oligophenolica]|uniref:Tyrosine-type recombinase/integrase n=1 Tax=Sphingomonas oligophenolica TaxID=301154 RepID=A0ABU9Y220_9SPHN
MLYDASGNRKYLTIRERRRFIEIARHRAPDVETFCLTLVYTGARISEVLALKATNIDRAAGIIVFESLKKRRRGVYRQVPVPRELLQRLNASHDLGHADPAMKLWHWSRTTAWKRVKEVMHEAGIPLFCAMPKALRHAYGVAGVSEARVPLNMMQKWLGHARIETTAIYANAVGQEERAIASRMWSGWAK